MAHVLLLYLETRTESFTHILGDSACTRTQVVETRKLTTLSAQFEKVVSFNLIDAYEFITSEILHIHGHSQYNERCD